VVVCGLARNNRLGSDWHFVCREEQGRFRVAAGLGLSHRWVRFDV